MLALFKIQFKKHIGISNILYRLIYIVFLFLSFYLSDKKMDSNNVFTYVMLLNFYTWCISTLLILTKDIRSGEIMLFHSFKVTWWKYVQVLIIMNIVTSLIQISVFLLILNFINDNVYTGSLFGKITGYYLITAITLFLFSMTIISFIKPMNRLKTSGQFIILSLSNIIVLVSLMFTNSSNKWLQLLSTVNWYAYFKNFQITFVGLAGIVIISILLIVSLLLLNRNSFNKVKRKYF